MTVMSQTLQGLYTLLEWQLEARGGDGSPKASNIAKDTFTFILKPHSSDWETWLNQTNRRIQNCLLLILDNIFFWCPLTPEYVFWGGLF